MKKRYLSFWQCRCLGFSVVGPPLRKHQSRNLIKSPTTVLSRSFRCRQARILNFMNSIISAVRIAISFLFALAAPPLFAQGTFYEGPVSVAGIFNGNVTTGCSYDPLTHSAHRAIDDIVVPGSIGKYPLKMTRYYNSRAQYYALTAIGLGPGWAHEYSWLMWTAGHRVVSPHGTAYDDSCGPSVGVSEVGREHTTAGVGLGGLLTAERSSSRVVTPLIFTIRMGKGQPSPMMAQASAPK